MKQYEVRIAGNPGTSLVDGTEALLAYIAANEGEVTVREYTPPPTMFQVATTFPHKVQMWNDIYNKSQLCQLDFAIGDVGMVFTAWKHDTNLVMWELETIGIPTEKLKGELNLDTR